ncbi:MAG: hypothetical protein IPK79_07850 [Vampirovibrionales bacterium]|nr:hypothetical protein [Vampirovibrionales bacterium]
MGSIQQQPTHTEGVKSICRSHLVTAQGAARQAHSSSDMAAYLKSMISILKDEGNGCQQYFRNDIQALDKKLSK